MQVAHKIKIKGGQDAGTCYDIDQIKELVATMDSSQVLAALQAAKAKEARRA